jgi:peroxiredoxin
MITKVKTHTNPRSIILITLWGMMLLSLVYSMSIQYGHADAPIADSAEQATPLGAGDMAPRFIVKSVAGENFDFDPRELERPAIIITFRGGWCPFCNMHLSELRHVIPQISAMDVDVLFLSGDRPELLFESLKAETQEDIASLDYVIYSDAEAHAAIALGIAFRPSETTLNRRNEKGDDIEGSSMRNHDVLAVPAVFAIDTDGVISFAYANPNFRVRLPADELLEVAKTMASRSP